MTLDFEALVERVGKLANPTIDGPALLEDPDVVEALVGLPPAKLDAFAYALRRRAGVRRDSVDDVVERARVRESEPGEEPEADSHLAEEAEDLLRDPGLLERFNESVQAGGHVGEERTAQALLLAMVTRVTDSPIHVVVKGASAAGKNHTVRAVTDHLPVDQVKEITDMSPKALQYGGDFAGKVIVLVEQNAGDRAEYPLRVAMSEGKITVMVAEKNPETGRMETREHTVECGCIVSTTTRAALNDENETRVLELTLDESREQTRGIAEAIAKRAACPPSPAESERRERDLAVWRCALGSLEPVDVVIPQAPSLAQAFSFARIRVRRDFPRLLAVVKANAILYQRQRERDGEGRIVANDFDVEVARAICSNLIAGVSPRLRWIYDRLVEAFGMDKVFTPPDAAEVLGHDPSPTRRNLKAMEDAGIAEVVEEGRGRHPSTWKLLGLRPFLSGLEARSDKIAGAVGESACRTDGPDPERQTEMEGIG